MSRIPALLVACMAATLVACIVTTAWPRFLTAYHASRCRSDPRHLQGLMAELRRDYRGSVPLGPGDGVPLPIDDAGALAIRKLLADPGGARLLARALESERNGERSTCSLHGSPLTLRITQIGYGLILENDPYLQASASQFPMAGYCWGGCMVGIADEALVLSCASCDTAEAAWVAANRARRRG